MVLNRMGSNPQINIFRFFYAAFFTRTSEENSNFGSNLRPVTAALYKKGVSKSRPWDTFTEKKYTRPQIVTQGRPSLNFILFQAKNNGKN